MGLNKNGLKKRLEAIKYGQHVCKQYNLNFLKIPEPNILVNDNLYAERKYRFIKDPKDIYSKEQLSKILEQLVLFICKTGTTDLTSQNFGFLSDGSGICLYDLEDIRPDDPSYGLRAFITGGSGHFGSECFQQTKEIIKANAPKAYEACFES